LANPTHDSGDHTDDTYDNTETAEDGNLRVGMGLRVPELVRTGESCLRLCRLQDQIEARGFGERAEILVSREQGNAPVNAGLGNQRVS